MPMFVVVVKNIFKG